MGKLILKRGDCFATTSPIMAHGVNTQGVMGSGFAAKVARLYPEVREAYLAKHKKDGWKVGEIQVVEVAGHDSLKAICNIASQKYYGYDDKVYVSYDGLRDGLNLLLGYAEDLGFGVAVPRIGCGLANGDWRIIECIMIDAIKDRSVNLEVWTL